MRTDPESILHRIDRESADRTARVRQLLLDEGRPDLVAELDAKLRDVRLGLDSARATWNALSLAQRRVMEILATGRHLVREHGSRTWYEAHGKPEAVARVCRLPTARNLIARELLACEGGAFDPERKLMLTERGQFVWKRGQTKKAPPA